MSRAQLRTAVVVMAALAVAVLLVLAAGTGPRGLVGSSDLPRSTAVPPPLPTETTSVAPQDPGREARPNRITDTASWGIELATTIAVIGGLWVLSMLLRFVVLEIGRRLPERQLVLELDPRHDLDRARESLRDDAAELREALASGEARNGIVACWVRLEDAAGEAGVTRSAAQTATELVVEFLHTLDVDPRPVAALAALFHEARFSTHPLPDDARVRAEEALAAILADLARARPATERTVES